MIVIISDMPVDQMSPNKARQILDRVDLLSKIREEILSHPHLEERLSLCQPSGDTPDWWIPGKHDKELLLGAAKHGLGRTDITILNDPDFSFHKVVGKSIFAGVPSSKLFNKPENKAIKVENRDDILKFDKDEILVKLEKGEGTLKIEKVGMKKDKEIIAHEKKPEESTESGQVELTIVKSEAKTDEKLSTGSLTITSVPPIKSPEPKPTEAQPDSKEMPVTEVTEEVKSDSEQEPEKKPEESTPEPSTESTEKEQEKATEEPAVSAPAPVEEKSTVEDKEPVAEIIPPESEIPEDTTNKTEEEPPVKSPEPTEDKTEEKPDVEEPEKMEVDKPESEKPEESEPTATIDPPKSPAALTDETQTLEADKKTETVGPETTEETSEPKIIEPEPTEEDSSTKSESKPEITSPTKADASPVKEPAPQEPEVDKNIEKEPPKAAKVEDKCSVQAAELKAMFPDLEVIQPLSRLTQIDTFVLRDKTVDYPETTVAQLFSHNYQASVKWPKEHAIEARLMHIVHAIEHKEWPVAMNFTAGDEVEIISNEKDNSEVITITTDHGISRALAASNNLVASKKRKRHIAIDVETERAKLHALLNSSHMTTAPPSTLSKPSMLQNTWDMNEESQADESRRMPSLPPPPAHQQARTPNVPFDLKYTVPGKTTIIPGTSSTLTPIDLSAGYMKTNTESNKDMMNQVQDFSMPNKNKQSSSNKGKLDSMLDKLMKRKNCPVDEPVVGKEKKRRKLDEIVLGLSAAKEQQGGSHYADHGKKSTITPNVTVTPTSAPMGLSNPTSSAQKPFSITVTSIPSSRASGSSNLPPPSLHSHKDSFSALLAQAEQQNRDLKKQQMHQAHQNQQQQQQQHHHQQLQQQLQQQHQQHQQQQAFNSAHMSSSSHRKSYEAMIADINKVAEYSSKIGSYSHEAKVNKWLAEQTAMSEQLSAEYLNAPRRRRPRVDPSLLDWKKLTGEENVAVINRLTGKKVS